MEAVKRKLRRAGDPVRAMEGRGSTLKAYTKNRVRLIKNYINRMSFSHKTKLRGGGGEGDGGGEEGGGIPDEPKEADTN